MILFVNRIVPWGLILRRIPNNRILQHCAGFGTFIQNFQPVCSIGKVHSKGRDDDMYESKHMLLLLSDRNIFTDIW